ncbi:MAG TPA: hypothetical protein VE982_01935 [Gaiellaceae bacterium]|nr:hypothetical protein [Gaiellaceae bacterium]
MQRILRTVVVLLVVAGVTFGGIAFAAGGTDGPKKFECEKDHHHYKEKKDCEKHHHHHEGDGGDNGGGND